MNAHVHTLRARRDLTKARMELLHQRAAGRAMTDAERQAWATLEGELTALDQTIVRLDRHAELSRPEGQPTDFAGMVARRAELVGTLEGIETLASEQDRPMTPNELARWDAAARELARLSPELDRLEHEASMAAHDAVAGDAPGTWSLPQYPG